MPSPTAVGRAAEVLAANHLAAQNHHLLDRNWRNRWCELDLVTRSTTGVHFVEVKFRRSTRYGFAAEYVSRDKSMRLIRAARAWCQAHGYAGPYQIDLITVEGELERPVITYLPNVITN